MSEVRSSKTVGAKAVALCALLLAGGGWRLLAQASAPAADSSKSGDMPVYDVATIKPNNSLSGSTDWDGNPGLLKATNITLKMALEDAFDIRQSLIYGLPGWAQSTHYDVVAKASDADPAVLKKMTREQDRAMLQQLLTERLHLKWHIEVKTLPVFDLSVVGAGIRFQPFTPKDDQDTGGDMSSSGDNHNVSLTVRGVTMKELAERLSRDVPRTVIDKTGLTGKYNLTVKWLRDDAPAGGDNAAPTIYTALQEQLGLKLVASKGPVDTLVIDNISQPTEN